MSSVPPTDAVATDVLDTGAVERTVLDIIRQDICAQFEPLFKLTCELTRELPLQPCNEIRNALNHFGRALNARSKDEALRNLENAKGHVILAITDCLCISIANREHHLSDYIAEVEDREDQIFVEEREKLSDIRIDRRKLPETGPRAMPLTALTAVADVKALSEICTDLGLIFKRYLALEIELKDHFNSPTLVSRRRIRERAHALWLLAGGPPENAFQFWLQAEREINAEAGKANS